MRESAAWILGAIGVLVLGAGMTLVGLLIVWGCVNVANEIRRANRRWP